jgi:ABC-2 type transport system permease protein
VVATLVKLRFLVLGNSLRRSPWQLVLLIIGGIYGLGIIAAAVVGLFALGFASAATARTVVVIAGSAVVLGWVVVPLLASGIDQTLDPKRLVTFPIPLGRLLFGLGVASMLGIPGIVTTIASLATAGTWWRQPALIPIALVCGAIGAATSIVAAQAVVALSGTVSSRRRFRELSSLIAVVPLILIGPVISSTTTGVSHLAMAFPALANALAWTPLGAIWSVPSSLALGLYGQAVAEFLIGLATLALLMLLWRFSLRTSLVTPPFSPTKERARGNLGFFSIFSASPTGAIAARSLTYWLRDPRYTRQLVIVPLVPVLMALYGGLSHNPGFYLATGPGAALFLSIAIYTDVSYDSTAFALHLAHGVSGRADRLGRIIGIGVFAVPIVILFTVVSTAFAGTWTALPSLLGLTLGILLTGLGVSSVSSSRFVFPVPMPGESPFRSRPGAGLSTALTTYAILFAVVVLVSPEAVLLIIGAINDDIIYGWICLAVGVVLGAVILVLGIRLGGRQLDADGVSLFQRTIRAR